MRGSVFPSGASVRRWLALVPVLCLAALAAAACGQSTSGPTPVNSPKKGPPITVAMVTHGQAGDPFWALVQAGAKQAASDFNVTLKYSSPKTTNPQEQAQLIAQAAAGHPQAMAVTIPDAEVIGPAVHQVTSSGIPTIVFNVGFDEYKAVGALTFVGQPETIAGAEAGRQMAAAGVKDALCVIQEAHNAALEDRCSGFTRALATTGGSVTTIHVNGNDPGSAQNAIEDALKKAPQIDGVLATGIIAFQVSSGALDALGELGKTKLGGFDVSNAGLTAVQSGQALFLIDQQPFLEGYDAVQIAAFQVRFGQHPFSPIFTGPSLITKANAANIAKLYKNTGVPLFNGGYP
jgi:simple sugar transport system substrate-binding protein